MLNGLNGNGSWGKEGTDWRCAPIIIKEEIKIKATICNLKHICYAYSHMKTFLHSAAIQREIAYSRYLGILVAKLTVQVNIGKLTFSQ